MPGQVDMYVCACVHVQRVHARECKQPECLSTRRNRKLLGEHASSAALRAPSGATAQEIRVKRFAVEERAKGEEGGGETGAQQRNLH